MSTELTGRVYRLSQLLRNDFGRLKIIDGCTLIVASWVIRARWWEIQRFVLEFKATNNNKQKLYSDIINLKYSCPAN